jgi:NADP-dependent 3-hydroxy acid dehydrogenase YdfG
MKNAVITGVSKGIGKALAVELLKEGYRVIGLGRNQGSLEHPNFNFFRADVRKHQEVESAFQSILKTYETIDVLVNNAGLGYFGFLEDMTYEQWNAMYETNVNGIFYCLKSVIPGMKKAQSGHIFNIASTAGVEGYPQVAAYCGTKFAVKGISQALYKELRDFGVKVTCVYPGSVKTDFFNDTHITAHDYMLMPEDVAKMMVHTLQTPKNFHTVNLEIRPLQPKGPKNSA